MLFSIIQVMLPLHLPGEALLGRASTACNPAEVYARLGITRRQRTIRGQTLQTRIDRLAFKRQNAKNTLVNPAQRLTAHEPFQRLDTKRKLA